MPKNRATPQTALRSDAASPARDAWYALTAEAALERLDSSIDGLTADEAAERLARYGRNALEAGGGVSAWRLFAHQFLSPLIYVLLAAMAVTLAIQHWADAIVIGVVITLNAVIGFTQEYRAENAMLALMRLVTPKATVRRNGRVAAIESADLVPGDVVLLQSGAMVPADLRLLQTARLEIDESPLTGESVPVHKEAHALPADRPLPVADRRNMAFLGTTITSGRGVGVVVATGRDTEVGAIAGEIRGAGRVEPPLQARMGRFGRLIAWAVLSASAVAFVVGLGRGEPLVEMFLTAVAIAVSAIPEGLPVVMTIALAVAVRRIARRNAIVRRLPAVETTSPRRPATSSSRTTTSPPCTVPSRRGGSPLRTSGTPPSSWCRRALGFSLPSWQCFSWGSLCRSCPLRSCGSTW